jgi:hypothetical protein
MAHDIARLIIKYSQNVDPPEPEEIRDLFKTNYYNLHQHQDWKYRFRTMVHDNNSHIIRTGLTLEENLKKCGRAPAYTWGKIKYDLDTDYSEFGINITDETDLNQGIFHINSQNTKQISDLSELPESENKYTLQYTNGWLYFLPSTKIREFLDYIFRFGLVPQLHQWSSNNQEIVKMAKTWWLRFDFLLNSELGT